MSNPDMINPDALTKRKGFGSRNPNAMTGAERQRRWRAAKGGRSINWTTSPEVAASVIYLKKEWGMKTDTEVIEAAVRFLNLCTRQGLTRLPQSVDD